MASRQLIRYIAALAFAACCGTSAVHAQTYEGPGLLKVGVFAQGAFANVDVAKYNSTNVFVGSESESMNNIGGGMTAGYDWRFGNVFVGAEVDGAFTSGSGTAVGEQFDTDYMVTARLRAGGWLRPDLLVYVTGGWAGLGVSHRRSDTPTSTGPVSTYATLSGWTVGGGAEYDLPGVTFFAEYLYASFGELSFRSTSASADLLTLDADSHIVRVGAKFKVGFDFDPFHHPFK